MPVESVELWEFSPLCSRSRFLLEPHVFSADVNFLDIFKDLFHYHYSLSFLSRELVGRKTSHNSLHVAARLQADWRVLSGCDGIEET